MRKFTKKNLISIFALFAVAAIPAGFVAMNNMQASAENVTSASSEFYMEEGAAVRTSADKLGIRFSATITEDYWTALQTEYGATATYEFYSVVTDGVKPITKDYGTLTPDFTEEDVYTFYSTIVYNTEELIASGLLDAACDLELSAQTYVKITKEGEETSTTIAAYGQTGKRSMKAVANAAALAGEADEELSNYFVEGYRSEKQEGYVFDDNSGFITMANLPDLTEATDVEVYYGATKLDATYANGTVSFSGVELKADQTQAYISVFADNTVYSAKVGKAKKIAQANAADLLTLAGNETVVLTEDIDLAGIEWNGNVTFTGVFDGNNHAIKNLTTVTENAFFKVLAGKVKNVAFTGVTLTAGTAVLAFRGGTATTTVENVFIQVVKTNSSTSNRFGAICERQNNVAAMNLTNVLIVMPGTAANEAIYGYTLKGQSSLTNVHCVGLPNEAASIQNSGTMFKGTYTLHANLGAFTTAKTTLTPFLDACIVEYLNIVKISQANATDMLTLAGDETVVLMEDIDLAGIEWNGNVTFTGTLDGNNHAIKNLTTVAENAFFKVLAGKVKNVAFTGVTLTAGTAVLAFRGGTATTTVENVFIQVVKTNSSGSNRFGIICERQNNAAAMNLTNVVMKTPGTAANEAIYGYTLKGQSSLTNVHCIGLPNEAASIQNTGTYFKGTYTLHADLAAFNSAEKTLTPFLTTCVETYLNANA